VDDDGGFGDADAILASRVKRERSNAYAQRAHQQAMMQVRADARLGGCGGVWAGRDTGAGPGAAPKGTD
jgi:hypothetical protein